MATEPIVWALIDDRPGTSGQVLGLAEALGWPYISKNIRYNLWAKLPSCFLGSSLIGVDPKRSSELLPPFPDIVVSAGRRSAVIASYIKKLAPNCFTVQIMRPGSYAQEPDFLILPLHDNPKIKPNLITTIGALHRLTNQQLEKEAAQWRQYFQVFQPPFVALIVGGSSKAGKFTETSAKELAALASDLAQKLGGTLAITTSRRTGKKASTVLKKNITVPHFFYEYGSTKANPYLALLALSDAIIVTGDSISMCSEACYLGKPVYIYAPHELAGAKHQRFLRQLYEKNYAHLLASEVIAEGYDYNSTNRLDETSRVASIIKKNYFSRVI
jgi:hypothetical protein